MILNSSLSMTRSPASRLERPREFVGPGRARLLVGLLCIGVSLLVGCGDEAFCDSLCDDLVICGASLSFDECSVACEGELQEARDLGGAACVVAHEDYLDCSVSDFCEEIGDVDSLCRRDAIEAEIEPCGEFVGEF